MVKNYIHTIVKSHYLEKGLKFVVEERLRGLSYCVVVKG